MSQAATTNTGRAPQNTHTRPVAAAREERSSNRPLPGHTYPLCEGTRLLAFSAHEQPGGDLPWRLVLGLGLGLLVAAVVATRPGAAVVPQLDSGLANRAQDHSARTHVRFIEAQEERVVRSWKGGQGTKTPLYRS